MATIPIFISSTFEDFHTERDLLNGPVQEQLNLTLREMGSRVVMVDLRWGIDTTPDDEDAAERRILEVCLAEVDRARPFFLGLVGDRYGTVPDPVRARWVADAAGIPRERDVEGISVTALEFSHGFLWDKASQASQTRRTASRIVFFRQSRQTVYPAQPWDLHARRLTALRRAIRDAAGRDSSLRVFEYSLPEPEPALAHLTVQEEQSERFVSLVVESLLPALTEHVATLAGVESQSAGRRLFRESHPFNTWREHLTEELHDAITGPKPAHHGIYGPSGCGKSALAVDLERSLRSNGTPHAVVYVDSEPGTQHNRTIMIDAVRQLCSRIPDLSATPPSGDTDAIFRWWSTALHLAVARLGALVLVVDGIDRVANDGDRSDLTYLKMIPADIGVLVTTGDEQQARRLQVSGFNFHQLGPFYAHEVAEAAQRWAGVGGRSLPDAALTEIGKDIHSPLWVRHAVLAIGSLSSGDFTALSSSPDKPAALAHLLASRAANLPEGELELAGLQLSTLERRIGKKAADLVLGLLGGSGNHLSVNDLTQLLEGHVNDPAFVAASTRQLLEGLLWESDTEGRLRVTHMAYQHLFNLHTTPFARTILARRLMARGVHSDSERHDLLVQIALCATNETSDELLWVARVLNEAEPTDMARVLLYLTIAPQSRIYELIRDLSVEYLTEQAWSTFDHVTNVPLYDETVVPASNRRRLNRIMTEKRYGTRNWLRRIFRN